MVHLMPTRTKLSRFVTITVEHEGISYEAILSRALGRVQLRRGGRNAGSCEWAGSLIGSFDADVPEGVYDLVEQALAAAV